LTSPIHIIEVAPRDGLQNETRFVPTATKVAFVDALSATGLREIEVSAFVSPKWLPQLRDAEQVFAAIQRRPGVVYSALVPNQRGLLRAATSKVDKIAVLCAASAAFTQSNLNTDIATSLQRCREITRAATMPVRGYVSTAFHCPFTGPVEPTAVLAVVEPLLEMGCSEVAISDTVGSATPDDVARLLQRLLARFPAHLFALHMHDRDGHAEANCRRAAAFGITRFDGAVTGRSGCPYAPGAGGNVATLALAQAFADCTALDQQALERAAAPVQSALETAA